MGNSESRLHQLREKYDSDGPSSNSSTPKKKPKFLSLPSLPNLSRSVSPCKSQHHHNHNDIPVILKDPAPESPSLKLDPFDRRSSPCSRSHSPLSLEPQKQAQANHLQLPYSIGDPHEPRHLMSLSRRSTRSNHSDSTHHTSSSFDPFYRQTKSPPMESYNTSNKRLSQITQHSTFSKTMGSSDRSDYYDDEEEALNRPGFHLAEDLWHLRGLSQFTELVRDKHRRTHFFLKRVWKADYLAPIENPSLMIHWASCPGSWCLEMALSHPNSKIVGIDQVEQSKITFTSVSNLMLYQCPMFGPDGGMARFENDSADLIVVRDDFIYLVPKDQWLGLLGQFYRVLKPGGYLELYGQDYALNAKDPYGKQMDQWIHHLADRSGVSYDLAHDLETSFNQLGFGKKDYRQVDLPIGDWPSSQCMKEIGYLAKIIIFKRFKLLKHWILALEPKVTEEEYMDTLRNAMEVCEREKHHFISYYYGVQKPLPV